MTYFLPIAPRGAVLLLLGVWFLFSVWHQGVLVYAIAKRRALKTYSWDIFSLVPFWCFWTGSPTWDSMLLYRDKLGNGQFTPWKNAWEVSPHRFAWIWSPQTRKLRAIEGWFQELVSLAEGTIAAGQLFLSRRYVAAATYVSGLQRSPGTERRQFMIARVCGFDQQQPAEILFVSPLFRLDE